MCYRSKSRTLEYTTEILQIRLFLKRVDIATEKRFAKARIKGSVRVVEKASLLEVECCFPLCIERLHLILGW